MDVNHGSMLRDIQQKQIQLSRLSFEAVNDKYPDNTSQLPRILRRNGTFSPRQSHHNTFEQGRIAPFCRLHILLSLQNGMNPI
jgi:hypothetical protein